MWRWIGGGFLVAAVFAIGLVYLELRDPRIDTAVPGDATLEELHSALSPCPRTYDKWPFERDFDRTAPGIRADAWWRIESVGEVIAEQSNGTHSIAVDAVLVNPGDSDVAARVEAIEGGPWLPTYFEWGLREAKSTYVSTLPSVYGDGPFVWNVLFELEDGRWFHPGCHGGTFLTQTINDATEATARAIIEFTGDDLQAFLTSSSS